MSNSVKDFLEKARLERMEKQSHERNVQLLKWGLFEKEYSDGPFTEEYPYYDSEVQKAYKKIPMKVSNEDYAELCSLEAAPQKDELEKNTIAEVLVVIAWVIFAGGFLLGLILANGGWVRTPYSAPFAWETALSYWVNAFVWGVVFLGFAEVIKLLQHLVNRTYRK